MGKVNDYFKIMIENHKKILKSKKFYLNLDLIDGLGMEFTAC